MTKAVKPNYDVAEAKLLFSQVVERLSENDWFLNDWLHSVHQFPPSPQPAECATLHVYRSDWFNDDRQGIHFESFLGPKEWKKQVIPVMMHIFHCDLIPGTNIKRRAVATPFVDEVFDKVSSWPGYVFRVGKYGAHPFTCTVEFEFATFADKLAIEFSRLCLELGPVMDKTLKDVLPSR